MITYSEIATLQLRRLSRALGLAGDYPRFLECQETLFEPWGEREIPRTPVYPSFIADDHAPYEYSIAFSEGGAIELRILTESQGETPDIGSNHEAALATNRLLAQRFGVDLGRYRQVEDLFCPENPAPPFTIWHACCLRGGHAPDFKLYLNPATRGASHAGEVVGSALERLGMRKPAELLRTTAIPRGPELDQVKYFSLDLAGSAGARVKVYVAHRGITGAELERVVSLSGAHRPGEAATFLRGMTGRDGPFEEKPVITCYSFVEGHDAPLAVTVHLPIALYVDDDATIVGRVSRFMDSYGMRSDAYRAAMEALEPGPLEHSKARQAYTSYRRERSGAMRFTVYLAAKPFELVAGSSAEASLAKGLGTTSTARPSAPPVHAVAAASRTTEAVRKSERPKAPLDVPEDEDFARVAQRRTLAGPYKTKVVERIELKPRAEREAILERASYSPVQLDASDVYIDLVTDSGSGAMSDLQWSALMRGDEAYMRSRSFHAFEESVREVTGFPHVVPTHQGRAAEHIAFELLVEPGQIVLSNTHFDTTRAHVVNRGATPVDLVGEGIFDFATSEPWKGDFDLAKLEAALARHHERVGLVVITVLNNFAGSSPVSMANIRAVKALADRYEKRVFFDACRFAENAHFIKAREPGYEGRSIASIVHEMLSYGEGCWMSAKKDALVNIGGFLATRDPALARRFQEKLVLYEGFYTYGGLARRDLEAIAVGLREGIDEAYLAHRTGLVAYLGERLEEAGVVVSRPIGGSGVFVDVASVYPHLPPDRLPGIALCADLYREGGVRIGAAPFPMKTVSPRTGEIEDRVFQFARFAVPRRVYDRAHMDYVGEIMGRVKEGASSSRGYRIVEMPEVLGHFFAKFAPYDS